MATTKAATKPAAAPPAAGVATGRVAQVLGHFEHQSEGLAGALIGVRRLQRAEDRRQVAVELHVDDGADDLNDAAGGDAGLGSGERVGHGWVSMRDCFSPPSMRGEYGRRPGGGIGDAGASDPPFVPSGHFPPVRGEEILAGFIKAPRRRR